MASVLTPSPPRPTTDLPQSDELYEIVDGVRVEKIVSAYAVWIASRLVHRLGPFVEERGIGTCVTEMIFILDEVRDLRRRPDLALLTAATWPVGQPPPPQGDWAVIPDLAVEVISPGNAYDKMIGKLQEYFAYGVTEVWIIVPPQRLVQVYRSLDEVRTFQAGQSLTSELVPGWSTPVASLLPHVMPPAEEQSEIST
jgi:Uma2 family endonuclease